MKSWILLNKNVIPFFAIFLISQLINKFGEFTGQYAKLEMAIFLAILYTPVYIYSIKNINNTGFKDGALVLLLIPLYFELLFNLYHGNHTNIAYYDLSVMAISAIFLIYFSSIEKSLEDKSIILGNIILSASIIIIIITLLNSIFYFDGNVENKGRFITGNQNISSYILLASLPFLIILKLKNLSKIIYSVLVVLIIGLILKSRAPTIIAIIYSTYIAFKILDLKINKTTFGVLSIATLSTVIFLILNDRFYNLINYDVYIRILPILRLYDGISVNQLFLGVGTGNLAIFFNSIQDRYPALEIMIQNEAFTYAHNFLIDRLISAGFLVTFLYLSLYGFIIFKYLKKEKKTLNVQVLFHAFCIGLLLSLYDVVHNSISGYSIFTLITGLLILNLVEFQIKFKKLIFITILISLSIPIALFKYESRMGHHFEYNKIINSINGRYVTQENIETFSKVHPHYAEIDTLNTYYRYINNKSKVGEKDFQSAFDNMNSFNKYKNARLHFSSQYYALNNMNDNLLEVYSDIFYRNLILQKVITPLYDRQKITVKSIDSSSQNISFISKPCCILNIPRDMYNQIKYVNSGITNLKISEESINFVTVNAIYSVDSNDSVRDTKIVTKFLQEINNYSEALKF